MLYKERPHCRNPDNGVSLSQLSYSLKSIVCCFGLLTQAEGLDDGTVAVDVVYIEILQQLAAAAYHHRQRAGCHVVLVVLLQVLSQVLDAVGEQSNLALCRTCVGG